ncbi:uncharacterized protein [Fopius arisanus]|uniref:TINF2 protein n=1 Tax=Fopius arisanus TaxID=64838 RepID=A0A0C9RTV6_9HYME|nr:PREDICTED: uncharacterized protein LOC105266181 [Fopius arisanus]
MKLNIHFGILVGLIVMAVGKCKKSAIEEPAISAGHCIADPKSEENGKIVCSQETGVETEKIEGNAEKYKESHQDIAEKPQKLTENYSEPVLECAKKVMACKSADEAFLALWDCDSYADSVKRYLLEIDWRLGN